MLEDFMNCYSVTVCFFCESCATSVHPSYTQAPQPLTYALYSSPSACLYELLCSHHSSPITADPTFRHQNMPMDKNWRETTSPEVTSQTFPNPSLLSQNLWQFSMIHKNTLWEEVMECKFSLVCFISLGSSSRVYLPSNWQEITYHGLK